MTQQPPQETIALSVVVIPVGGKAFVQSCLRSLTGQAQGRVVEIIVPYGSSQDEIGALGTEFPQCVFLRAVTVHVAASAGRMTAAHESYDQLKSAGLAVARGDVLALLEDTVTPDPDWCEQVLAAHRLPHGVIGGAVEHAGQSILNWAVYLMDFGRYQLPLREGPARYLTDINVSYKRATLDACRELWQKRYGEVALHWSLARTGVGLWLRPQMVVRQDRGALDFHLLIRERFAWGRLFGAVRAQETSRPARAVLILTSPAIPLVRLGRLVAKVVSSRRNRLRFVQSFLPLLALTLAWSCGELAGLLTGREAGRVARRSQVAPRPAQPPGRS